MLKEVKLPSALKLINRHRIITKHAVTRLSGVSCFFLLLIFLIPGGLQAQALIVDHQSVAAFDSIPTSFFDLVRTNYNFYYGHTSHGSQIVTGVNMLAGEDSMYNSPTFYEISDDLGHLGDISWVSPTRAYLDSHPECNVVMWSWCGGASDNTEAGINTYLNAMTASGV